MNLPSYNHHAVSGRMQDLELITGSTDLNDLCRKIYSTDLSAIMTPNVMKQYLMGEAFRKGADFLSTEEYFVNLSLLIMKMMHTAATFGFPGMPPQGAQESHIDIALTKAMAEGLEENGFTVLPCQGNSAQVQQFMTQRVFPLITYWRWKVVTGKSLSLKRVQSSPRNYFYVLWISGWLYDRGAESPSGRWELLEHMSADSLVQVIERPGLGYRKGFAQAIAMERKVRSTVPKAHLDKVVRGAMKRASFTFSTSVMPDDVDYYSEICRYLFSWAERNYFPEDIE